ncbi:MAG: acyl-ACP--UDP-N-acetylglucosamine O-acyltransferase [Deltaproteobacteria bacterium]|nr:acyl-ACP--UDP-N-acetylglucosamine O-acyltransferase [Deltaproteobacteria bacterium]
MGAGWPKTDDNAYKPPTLTHPTAVVGPEVELSEGVEVGPFCLLRGKIRIGAGTRLISHVAVFGDTEIGCNNVLHPFAVVGDEPQDISYRGGPRRVRIGDRNVLREGVTVHRGSERGEVTVVGNDNFLMQNSHVAHDCRVGNSVILGGGALLAGWVEVGDMALISGNCVVHQFVRIGRLALMRGLSRTSRDIPPFCVADQTHTLRGINVVGARRAGFSAQSIAALRRAFALLFGTRRNLRIALEQLGEPGGLAPEVEELAAFIRSSRRGVAFGRKAAAREEPEPA